MGSCPAARRGAPQRAGLTPASASNTLSCLLEMLHSKQLRSIKMLVDSNHGIYRDLLHRHGPIDNDQEDVTTFFRRDAVVVRK